MYVYIYIYISIACFREYCKDYMKCIQTTLINTRMDWMDLRLSTVVAHRDMGTVVYCGILWYCVWEWFNSNHTVTIDNHSVYGLIWFNYNLWYRIVSGYGFTMFYTYNNCSWMNIHIPQGYRVLTRTHIHPW